MLVEIIHFISVQLPPQAPRNAAERETVRVSALVPISWPEMEAQHATARMNFRNVLDAFEELEEGRAHLCPIIGCERLVMKWGLGLSRRWVKFLQPPVGDNDRIDYRTLLVLSGRDADEDKTLLEPFARFVDIDSYPERPLAVLIWNEGQLVIQENDLLRDSMPSVAAAALSFTPP